MSPFLCFRFNLEPLFADLGTLAAHREDDEDFGELFVDNPEFFVDFAEDPFEDVPSTSEGVDHGVQDPDSSFVFDPKIHSDDLDFVDDEDEDGDHDEHKPSKDDLDLAAHVMSLKAANCGNSILDSPQDLLCRAVNFKPIQGSDRSENLEEVKVERDEGDEQLQSTVPEVHEEDEDEDDDENGCRRSSCTEDAPPRKKLKPKPSPLCITQSSLVAAPAINSPTPYQSLLRSPLLSTTPYSPPPYTPPPMLSPCRKATGLFSNIEHSMSVASTSKGSWVSDRHRLFIG